MSSPAPVLLEDIERRLRLKKLFGAPGDTLSVRVPGAKELLLSSSQSESPKRIPIETEGDDAEGLHAAIYRSRPDAGAILVGASTWTSAVAALGRRVPPLFDEQARHLGATYGPIAAADVSLLVGLLEGGGNVAIHGIERICLGSTPARVVLNADLFEKCAKAFVVAHLGGHRVRALPLWMRYLWGRRLRRDQKRAADAYAAGRIPEGMDAY